MSIIGQILFLLFIEKIKAGVHNFKFPDQYKLGMDWADIFSAQADF